MTYSNPYAERKAANDKSKGWANRDKEAWTDDEDEFLFAEWVNKDPVDRDEVVVSQILERTIESCRNRCEKIRKQRGIMVFTRVEVITTAYVGCKDEADDQWWSPDYYTDGGSHA